MQGFDPWPSPVSPLAHGVVYPKPDVPHSSVTHLFVRIATAVSSYGTSGHLRASSQSVCQRAVSFSSFDIAMICTNVYYFQIFLQLFLIFF